MADVKKFDRFLNDDGPAALVIREWLTPVEGPDGVLFPATFASGDGFEGGYNIDPKPVDAQTTPNNVCLIDTVGSQANRIEPIFAKEKYAGLVPQIVVTAGDKRVNLLEAGHRAGDALVRCSSIQQELQDAFKSVLKGDSTPLAKIAPTSLVFGVWDSRDTQAKLPRLVASTIRAFNVRKLRRSAQYNPALPYVENQLLDDPTDKASKDVYSQRGFIHVPAAGTHGGVIADGGVRRDATLGLAALRLLSAQDAKQTLALQRYILGLALTAFTANSAGYLRQGCLLVADPDKPKEFVAVHADGKREALKLTHDEAVEFAKAAAKEFGIDPARAIKFGQGPDREVPFDKDRAKKDVSPDAEKAAKKKATAKK